MARMRQAIDLFTGSKSSGDAFAIIAIVVASGLLVLPIALVGIPENYDLPQHLRFAHSYFETFSNGSIFPAWAANDNLGFGSVGIRFYPPLTYLPIAIAQFVTGSTYDSLWLSVLFWMIVGGIGTYTLAREMLPVWYALFAALLYAIVPYHLVQVYQAFLLAEFAASAILPFCFLFAYRTVRYGSVSQTLLFAVTIALLIISHIPSTIIGSLSLGVFIAALLERGKLVGRILRIGAAFVLGLAATSFYWVRMVTELGWLKHNTREFYGEGYYNYATYFFPMFVNGGEAYGPRFLWLWDIIIVITLFLLVPGIILTIVRWKKGSTSDRPMIAFILAALFAFFMMSLLSAPLWDNFLVLQKLQFPWRWLAVASLGVSMAFVMAVYDIYSRSKRLTRPLAYSLTMVLTAVFVFDLTQAIIPSAPVPRGEFNKRLETLDSEAGCECWWPIWASRGALENDVPVDSGSRVTEIFEWQPTRRSFTVAAGESETIRVATFYYPHWRAKTDGEPTAIWPDHKGAIEIGVGRHPTTVTLEFIEPDIVIYSRYFSPVVWILILVCLGFATVRHIRLAVRTGLA